MKPYTSSICNLQQKIEDCVWHYPVWLFLQLFMYIYVQHNSYTYDWNVHMHFSIFNALICKNHQSLYLYCKWKYTTARILVNTRGSRYFWRDLVGSGDKWGGVEMTAWNFLCLFITIFIKINTKFLYINFNKLYF